MSPARNAFPDPLEDLRPGTAGDPCAGPSSRPPAGVVVGNRPLGRRALPGPALCAATGDSFAKAYERVAGGVLGLLRPGVSTYSPPLPPPPMVRVFPAPIPRGARDRKAEGGGSSVPAGTAKGNGSRGADVPGPSCGSCPSASGCFAACRCRSCRCAAYAGTSSRIMRGNRAPASGTLPCCLSCLYSPPSALPLRGSSLFPRRVFPARRPPLGRGRRSAMCAPFLAPPP